MTKDNPVPGNSEDHSEVEPTTVGLPKLEPLRNLPLDVAERSAVEALPVGSALLVAHEGPNRGARFLLDQDKVTVGRHPDADIFLDDVTVSRQHAVFERDGEGFRVVDTGSLNGTYINNDRVDSLLLRTGMELQIGKFRLSYYAGTQQPNK
ncbi:FHA domain-containing protein [Enteractinococcus coprophilus]|uniref:PSer/pThr/pTyr-binding forkhead associated (FHA) protein n=1 Tax=Enteractinococcus coprophilus TaxID=1027633 RepID=A0A543AK11_9MICC|nr:FHA domain-containing protein [Enteractinococcus coprophilus]TQL72866.1 pSer/pThr/pTyr-binding forkhead associated (FHA) protein [Enteractinococcus coprophilus]